MIITAVCSHATLPTSWKVTYLSVLPAVFLMEPTLSKFFRPNNAQAVLDQAHVRLLQRRVAGRTQTPSESLAIAAWCSAFESDRIFLGPLEPLHVLADALFGAEAASLSRMMSRADGVTFLGFHRDM
jgi:hypothetical protein